MFIPNFCPFPELETQRLLLRRMTKADAPEILALRSNEEVMKYIDREKPKSISDAENFINKISDSIDSNDGIMWGISLKEDARQTIGNIGYWRLIKQHYRAEIGYMLHPSFWKQGIMKEAMAEVIHFGLTTIGLHSIEAHINPDNEASAALLQSSGFIKEAHFKEDYFFKGRFLDSAIYSKLAG